MRDWDCPPKPEMDTTTSCGVLTDPNVTGTVTTRSSPAVTWTDDGRLTTASARRGVASVDARVVTLAGGAQLHGSDEAGQAVEVRSEFLEARLDEGIVRTDQPVQVVHGTQQLSAAGLVYERDRGRLRFDGPVRARLAGVRR